jgi:Vitamin K-dependent gamma-carboxylase
MSAVHRSNANQLDSSGQTANQPGLIRGWFSAWLRAWDRFWFSPSRPETLAIIRIACGSMLAYVHLIWLSAVSDFLGPTAWINQETIRSLHAEDWGWSWLQYVQSLPVLYLHQAIAIAASLAMALGWFTRIAIPLVWWLTLMVCNRLTGALFGLDQIVMLLSMYLMWSNSGSVWSLDARAASKRGFSWLRPSDLPAVNNTIATRLIQLHLCVIYLFGGLSKMRGEMWWDGSAFWFSVVNYEYQSLNLTWLGNFPILVGIMTAVTIFWETSYCAIIWPSLTRPVALVLALLVHGGIGLALGMWTFGTIMIVANLAFVHPQTMCRALAQLLPNYFRSSSKH